MTYTLGKNVKKGELILLKTGWKKIVAVKDDGVEVPDGFIKYGWEILGWKK